MTHRMDFDQKPAPACQAVRCSLPPSVLPWIIEAGDGSEYELWLCHGHGQAVSIAALASEPGVLREAC